jgi:hypothetical protein
MSWMRSLTQADACSQRIEEDIMYHHGITAAIAREARAARRAGTAPRAGRRGWPRLILNPARAR